MIQWHCASSARGRLKGRKTSLQIHAQAGDYSDEARDDHGGQYAPLHRLHATLVTNEMGNQLAHDHSPLGSGTEKASPILLPGSTNQRGGTPFFVGRLRSQLSHSSVHISINEHFYAKSPICRLLLASVGHGAKAKGIRLHCEGKKSAGSRGLPTTRNYPRFFRRANEFFMTAPGTPAGFLTHTSPLMTRHAESRRLFRESSAVRDNRGVVGKELQVL
jgi:hypothetical protein